MTSAYGIDFGTSNSSIGVCDRDGPRLIEIQKDATSVPTALFFNFDDDMTVFGQEALDQYFAREPGRYLRAIKSVLGTSLFEEKTQVKTKRYDFGEIIASFLRFLRTAAAEGREAIPSSVVLGRPAFFVDDDSEADAMAEAQLETAAKAAGFETVSFQFEPIAAALDYEQSVNAEEIAFVADIGGGTSDFSVVRVSPERAQSNDRRRDILGYGGVHIGGTDFDRQLALTSVMPELGLNSRLRQKGMDAPSWYFYDLATWQRIGFLYEPKVLSEVRSVLRDSAEPDKIKLLLRILEQRQGHDLLASIENAKISLSHADTAALALRDILSDLELEVTRKDLFSAIAENLRRIQTRISDVLAEAGLQPAQVSAVFLTGGTTRMPSVRDAITTALPGARVIEGNAFGSVATGLALDAARQFGPSFET
ncbi:MAG: Hsp70 family protein [Pseudomonadota bacterium]